MVHQPAHMKMHAELWVRMQQLQQQQWLHTLFVLGFFTIRLITQNIACKEDRTQGHTPWHTDARLLSHM
jgi:hypothetical protein